jgi:GNAT superfamily N-acetyltransferase
MDIISEALNDSHILTSFDSGNESLNSWLRSSAHRAQAQATGRTFVWHEGDDVVVAYFTLAAHMIHRDGLARSAARSLPASIPAILLAKLALDRGYHGQRLGGQLLIDALSRAVQAGRLVASRYVVVDAIDEAAKNFYVKYGFKELPNGVPMRLVRPLQDIAADLAST